MSESKREQQHWVRIKFLTSTKAFPLLFFLFFWGGGGRGGMNITLALFIYHIFQGI